MTHVPKLLIALAILGAILSGITANWAALVWALATAIMGFSYLNLANRHQLTEEQFEEYIEEHKQ